MKKYLHTKYGWFKCRFSIFDKMKKEYEIVLCKWCEKQYMIIGNHAFEGASPYTIEDLLK